MNILVTGASGFLGSNVMDAAIALGHTAVGFTRQIPPGDAAGDTSPGQRYVIGDIRDRDSIRAAIRDVRPSHIVHAAAVTPTPELERDDPMGIVETNEMSTLTILQAAGETGVERVAFISSAAVYAHEGMTAPLGEDSPLALSGGLYALTKIASERLCRWATNVYGLETVSLRLGPVYGMHEQPTSSRHRMSAINRAVDLALAGEPIRCSKPDAVYDWIFGTDAAGAIITALQHAHASAPVFNLAGPNIRMDDLLEALSSVIPGTRVEWVDAGQENLVISDGYRRAPLDTTRLRSEIGFQPSYTVEGGLRAYVARRVGSHA